MKGISVYSRPDRPTVYIAYDCPRRLRRVCESSGIPTGDPQAEMKAYNVARERSCNGLAAMGREVERWETWVEPWLRMRYAHQQRTLTSYLGAWKFLRFWLREARVATPRMLTYQHAIDFVTWRESQVKRSGRKVGRNTGLHNCKVMSRIMREAVRRGFAPGNPWFRLSEDIPAAPVPEKPELTDKDIATVRAELARRAKIGRPSDWMPIAFEIALHQWCRLSATQIPMDHIDLEANTIRLHEKGGAVFTMPIHPGLRPLLVRLKADKNRKFTCVLPVKASRIFSRVFRAVKLPHCFHCTRVTGITRMARAGIPEQIAMAAVHHGSWAVHKGYQRLKPADVKMAHAAVSFSAAAAPACESPQNPDAHPARPTPLPASSSGPQRSDPLPAAQRAAG